MDDTNTRHRGRALWRLIIALAVLAAVAVLVVSGLRLRDARRCILCQDQLGRQLYEAIRKADGTLLSAAEFAQSPAARLRCPSAGAPYVYRPFEGPVRDSGPTLSYRMIAWCPKASHGGKRVVLLETGCALLLSEERFREACAADYTVNIGAGSATRPSSEP